MAMKDRRRPDRGNLIRRRDLISTIDNVRRDRHLTMCLIDASVLLVTDRFWPLAAGRIATNTDY